MKIAATRFLVLSGIIVSSLLLLFTANCSLEKSTKEKSANKQSKGGSVKAKSEQELPVANPFCITCHYNFDEEELALDHELFGIGCERCHGESQRHRSDENNLTPPEIMYPKDKINPTCMMCHPRHKIKDTKEHAALLAGAQTTFDEIAEGPVSGKSGQEKYCTDCHGKQHRITVRTVRWDKATGQLLQNK